MRRTVGIGVALAIGMVVVAVTFGGESLANDGSTLSGLIDTLPYFLILAVWVAVPFLILALARVSTRAPWLVGLALTIIAWTGFLIFAYAFSDPADGANIGLGVLLMASPVIIAVICIAVAFAKPRGDRVEGS